MDGCFFFLAGTGQGVSEKFVGFSVFGFKGNCLVEIGDSLFGTFAKQVVLTSVVVYFEIGRAEFGGSVEALECIFVFPMVLQCDAFAYPCVYMRRVERQGLIVIG